MGINLLDKRISILLIILLFATVNVFGEDLVAPEGELSKDDLILQQAQQQVLATSNVSTQMNQMALQQTENLEIVATMIINSLNETRTTLIITILIVALASQGLWWAIFLYFQTKGMLPAIKTKKQPNLKKPKKAINLQTVID